MFSREQREWREGNPKVSSEKTEDSKTTETEPDIHNGTFCRKNGWTCGLWHLEEKGLAARSQRRFRKEEPGPTDFIFCLKWGFQQRDASRTRSDFRQDPGRVFQDLHVEMEATCRSAGRSLERQEPALRSVQLNFSPAFWRRTCKWCSFNINQRHWGIRSDDQE